MGKNTAAGLGKSSKYRGREGTAHTGSQDVSETEQGYSR